MEQGVRPFLPLRAYWNKKTGKGDVKRGLPARISRRLPFYAALQENEKSASIETDYGAVNET